MDADRRRRFRAWFAAKPMLGDRAKLMEKTGLSKGRVTQLLDKDEAFGERAAKSLALKLGLDARFFEADPGEVGAWPLSNELLEALRRIDDPEQLRRAENQLRAFLELPTLAATSKRRAA